METEAIESSSSSSPKKTISVLPFLAIVISVIAIAVSVYGFLSTKEKQANLQTAMLLQAQHQSNRLHNLHEQLLTIKAGSTLAFEQKLAEIRYFITVAHVQLFIEHNPQLALETLQLAQKTTLEKPDTAWLAFNQALQSDMDALRAAPAVPTTVLFSQLTKLVGQVQSLSSLPQAPSALLQQHTAVSTQDDTNKSWYAKWLDGLAQLKSLVMIRHVDETVAPLVTPNVEMILKQNITQQLVIAQWALLHRDEMTYQAALQNAQKWVTQYFALSAEKTAVITALSQLLMVQVNPSLPNLDKTTAALAQLESVKVQVIVPHGNSAIPTRQFEMLLKHPIAPPLQTAPVTPGKPSANVET